MAKQAKKADGKKAGVAKGKVGSTTLKSKSPGGKATSASAGKGTGKSAGIVVGKTGGKVVGKSAEKTGGKSAGAVIGKSAEKTGGKSAGKPVHASGQRPPEAVERRPSKKLTHRGGKDGTVTKSNSSQNSGPVENKAPASAPTNSMTSDKPKKNQAGIGVKDLEQYRQMLLMRRRELVGDMSSMEHEALRSSQGSNLSSLPLHMADMGTDNYEQEFTLGLVEKDRVLLREINIALAKIQDGTYGTCEGTGQPISKARLEAQPWAKYSIEHARKMEKAGSGRR